MLVATVAAFSEQEGNGYDTDENDRNNNICPVSVDCKNLPTTVTCSNLSTDTNVTCSNPVTCGNIPNSVTCGNIPNSVTCGNPVTCDNIPTNVTCGNLGNLPPPDVYCSTFKLLTCVINLIVAALAPIVTAINAFPTTLADILEIIPAIGALLSGILAGINILLNPTTGLASCLTSTTCNFP
jgi:hypothetical protein